MVTADDNPNQAFVMTVGGRPLEECAYFRTEGYSVSCALGVLPPGETKVVTVTYAYKAPATGDFSDKYRISWGGAGGLPTIFSNTHFPRSTGEVRVPSAVTFSTLALTWLSHSGWSGWSSRRRRETKVS